MALPARDKHDDLTPEEIAALIAPEQRVRDAALDTRLLAPYSRA